MLAAVVLSVGILAACNGGPAQLPDPSRVHSSELHSFRVEAVAEGLEHPWSLAFLSEEEALVTERPGRLSRVDLATGERRLVTGVPEVAHTGQGGLLDVAIRPDYEENGWVYLTYAASGSGGYATHLGRGRLEGNNLTDFQVLLVADPFVSGGRHFGSRLLFDDEGRLFMTVGDRGERDRAQDPSDLLGATLRLTDEGGVPENNPFAAPGRTRSGEPRPEIYSYGHRNSQGMALHPETGRLWQHEHGPRGGDEINLPEPGGNFGWPLASYGREYLTRRAIGPDPDEQEGIVPPVHYWEDSLAPSGMAFYSGTSFPDWEGDLFIGSLARERLSRLELEGEEVVGEEPLLQEMGWRVRDVRTGPDGNLYLLVDASVAPMVRLVPEE